MKVSVKEKKVDGGGFVVADEATEQQYFITDTNINLLEACIDTNSAALLIGETGTGKTTIIREVAKERGKHLVRISVNGSMGVEEILGKWLVNKGTTVWQDGVLTMSMREGHWVVMDEINAALPEILFVLHSLLDDERKIILPEKDNEIVAPHADFRFFATMNPPEEYAGTKDMNKALLSRFTAVINVDVLNDVMEVKLLVQKGATEATALKLVRLAQKLREHKRKDNIFYFCSTRDLVQCVHLLGYGLKLEDAVKGAIANKMSPKEFEVVKSEFGTILNVDFKLPYGSIEDMIKMVKESEVEMARLKLSYENKLVEKEKEIRASIGAEMSERARIDILEKLAALAKK